MLLQLKNVSKPDKFINFVVCFVRIDVSDLDLKGVLLEETLLRWRNEHGMLSLCQIYIALHSGDLFCLNILWMFIYFRSSNISLIWCFIFFEHEYWFSCFISFVVWIHLLLCTIIHIYIFISKFLYLSLFVFIWWCLIVMLPWGDLCYVWCIIMM